MMDAIFKTIDTYTKSRTSLGTERFIIVGESTIEIYDRDDFSELQGFFKSLGYNVIVIETEEIVEL